MHRYDIVDMFFDRYGNVLLIPLAHTEIGTTIQQDHPMSLLSPFGRDTLGKTIREALAYVEAHPFLSEKDVVEVWSTATGANKWEDFARDRQMIDICVDESDEYCILFYSNSGKDGFVPMYQSPEFDIRVPLSASDEELGKAVLDLLSKGIAHFDPDFFESKNTSVEKDL